MYRILLVGHDLRLLSTRAAVLQKISDHVASCNAAEALTFLESETPNLVVLCHSLSAEDAQRIADKAHGRSEGTRVLMLVSELDDPGRLQGDAKFDAITLPEPSRLITRTTELLQSLSNHQLEEIENARQRRIAS